MLEAINRICEQAGHLARAQITIDQLNHKIEQLNQLNLDQQTHITRQQQEIQSMRLAESEPETRQATPNQV